MLMDLKPKDIRYAIAMREANTPVNMERFTYTVAGTDIAARIPDSRKSKIPE